MTEKDALKKAKYLFEDEILTGTKNFQDGAKVWLDEERIPVKHLSAIIFQLLDTVVCEKGQPEQEKLGILLRYLIKNFKSGKKVEMVREIFDGLKKRVVDWFECESWSNFAKFNEIWFNCANFLVPLFSSKQHCEGLKSLDADDFKQIVEYFEFKDEYCDFAYSGIGDGF